MLGFIVVCASLLCSALYLKYAPMYEIRDALELEKLRTK